MARQTRVRAMKRKSQYKIKGSTATAMTKRKKGTFAPYNGMRGTNPQFHARFLGYGFPDRLTTNLVYTEDIILTPTQLNPLQGASYRLTSCFDPQNALGGGQPQYFDQLAGVYDRYKVNGSKITCVFAIPSTTVAGVGPYICGITCSDQTTIPTPDAAALIAAPNTSYTVMVPEDGSQQAVATYSSKAVYGEQMDNLQARCNANPNVNWYANVFIAPTGTVLTQAVNVIVIIEYNVTFSDVKNVVDL